MPTSAAYHVAVRRQDACAAWVHAKCTPARTHKCTRYRPTCDALTQQSTAQQPGCIPYLKLGILQQPAECACGEKLVTAGTMHLRAGT